MQRLKAKLTDLYKQIEQKEIFLSRTQTVLLLLILTLVFLFFASQLKDIYRIPIDKPYYTGQWDEPFALNAGINVLHNNGDPRFYNYGGTSVYPDALVFYFYCKNKGITPHYQLMDEKFANPEFPIARRIYPVKPIYITQVVAFILFLIGALLYVSLFSYLLLPVPFWLIPAITTAGVFKYYSAVMLPEIHIGVLAGITAIFFGKALLIPDDDHKRYLLYTILCAAAASFTAGAKINSLYIVLLPLSLLWRPFREKFLSGKHIAMFSGALTVPYVLVNPTVLFNPGGYLSWLRTMGELAEIKPQSWMERLPLILPFIKDIFFLNTFPSTVVILLFIFTCILWIKKNPTAFLGFMFFLLYSLQAIANMTHDLYPRHFSFLLLPLNLLILFPLIYLFQKAPKTARVPVVLVCLLITLWVFPPAKSFAGISGFKEGSFTTKWKRESRDELADFVKKQKAGIYFYDFHGFSLPDTIHNAIIPFSEISQLPDTLEDNQYIGLILYKTAKKKKKNAEGKYNIDMEALLARYQRVKVFGPPGGSHDISSDAPLKNPTILLLKEK